MSGFSLRAYGADAIIEVFDNHLVITRRKPGLIFDGPPAEQLIPLSSIKSLQFHRPGFASRGRLVLAVEGGGSGRKAGSPSDENTLFFSKQQLEPFERVVGAIKAAIAMPSLERMAMAAQRNSRIGGASQPPTGQQLEPTSTEQQSRYRTGGTYDARGGASYPQVDEAAEPLRPGLGGWWQDMPPMGKVILVAFSVMLTLGMCSSGTSSLDGAESTTSAEDNSAAAAPSTPEQMLSDLAEFVTGSPRTTQLGLTNGSGMVGEFCSGTDGAVVMAFGDPNAAQGNNPQYDRFSKIDADNDVQFHGKFAFDQPNGTITVRSLVKGGLKDEDLQPTPDVTMQVEQVSPGVVSISGVTFHQCIV
ncbi:hypothetical protein NSE01_35440 [Novosphingobium sediminis]|uniref:Uncharacterized protein n=1 Tax=Novosphingobium sediminis TaxID=707214 RepID=A0A512APU4_9SPHN|nr:hypothetical protein [Novosphingobium sediminis]GEO01712.1 hypothetical protein NSE01_35440 [Novosphingobium sediminis]